MVFEGYGSQCSPPGSAKPGKADFIVEVVGVAPRRRLQVLWGRFWAKCTNTCGGLAETPPEW
ncbi:hypothetical protein LQF76_11275 [Gloeomargaritales cyanobacterium VI4D9]|nr:hypothetical protein LQF76_11275 [Gloeomargaritales cyanobacterium VI4D9]